MGGDKTVANECVADFKSAYPLHLLLIVLGRTVRTCFELTEARGKPRGVPLASNIQGIQRVLPMSKLPINSG